MNIPIKKWHTYTETIDAPAGEMPLKKIAVVAIFDNPFAGRFVEDLHPLIQASVAIGAAMGKVFVEYLSTLKRMRIKSKLLKAQREHERRCFDEASHGRSSVIWRMVASTACRLKARRRGSPATQAA